MRRLIVPAVLVCVLALAGCADPTPDAAPTTPAAESSTPTPTASANTIDMRALEEGFVETVHEQVGEAGLVTYPDASPVKLGHGICDSLEANVSPAEIETTLVDSGISAVLSENVIMGAGVLLCSDQASKVTGGW
ncbi:DUF732 domain-containing protein [Microbacterium sp. NPDC055988]|uniref:DUF732 domain-containing protein n=1 Tax=Microbacterium sp. NPDC055988 TaxID=3345671 RepID=UPI0035D65D82